MSECKTCRIQTPVKPRFCREERRQRQNAQRPGKAQFKRHQHCSLSANQAISIRRPKQKRAADELVRYLSDRIRNKYPEAAQNGVTLNDKDDAVSAACRKSQQAPTSRRSTSSSSWRRSTCRSRRSKDRDSTQQHTKFAQSSQRRQEESLKGQFSSVFSVPFVRTWCLCGERFCFTSSLS